MKKEVAIIGAVIIVLGLGLIFTGFEITGNVVADYIIPEDSDVVLYLPMDGSSGGNNVGSVDCSVSGKFGKGCGFLGKNNYVDVGDIGGIENSLTISFWAKSNVPDGDTNNLMQKIGSGDDTFLIRWGANERVYVNFYGAWANQNFASDGAVLSDLGWHHIVTTFDGYIGKLYFDGSLQSGTLMFNGSMYETPHSVQIGNLNGAMDEVIIWSKALTEQEVVELYNVVAQENVIVEENPVENFNETGNETAIEKSFVEDTIEDAVEDEQDVPSSLNEQEEEIIEGIADESREEITEEEIVELECEFNRVYWSDKEGSDITSAEDGDIVYLNVEGDSCESLEVDFTVFEDDGFLFGRDEKGKERDVFENGIVRKPFVVRWEEDNLFFGLFGNDNEFVFHAKTNPEGDSGTLIVSEGFGTAEFGPTGNGFNDDYIDNITINTFVNQASITNVGWDGITSYYPIDTGGEINPAGSLGQDLAGLWHLNGDVNDDSGNGNVGAINGGTNCGAAGRYNEGCVFDGDGDYVAVTPPDFIENVSEFSISFWAKPSEVDPRNVNLFYSVVDNNQIIARYFIAANGVMEFEVRNQSQSTSDATTVNHAFKTDNGWHHYAGIFNGTTSIYEDGILLATGLAISGRTETGGVAESLSLSRSTAGWNGTLDDVAIWNRTLTDSEITGMVSAGPTGSFVSTLINLDASYNAVNSSWIESNFGNTNIEISNDSVDWCSVLNGSQVTEQSCNALPTDKFYYRANFNGNTNLDSVDFEFENIFLPICGDGLIEGAEVCECGLDGVCGNSDDDLAGESCVSQGYQSGNLFCNSNCLIFDAGSCVSGAVIYVDNLNAGDCNGNYNVNSRLCDGTDGDKYDTIQEAANVAIAGNTIYIREGVYNELDIVMANSGLPGFPITVSGYMNEDAIVEGGSNFSNAGGRVFDFPASTAGFSNFVFKDFGIRYGSIGFFFRQQTDKITDVLIDNIEMHGFSDGALKINSDGPGVDRLVVQNSLIYDTHNDDGSFDINLNRNSSCLAGSGSQDIVFRNNVMYGAHHHASSASIAQETSDNIIYINNTVYNNGELGIGSKTGGYNFFINNLAFNQEKASYYIRGPKKVVSGCGIVSGENSNYIMLNNIGIGNQNVEGNQGPVKQWWSTNAYFYGNTFISLKHGDVNAVAPLSLFAGVDPVGDFASEVVEVYAKNNLLYKEGFTSSGDPKFAIDVEGDPIFFDYSGDGNLLFVKTKSATDKIVLLEEGNVQLNMQEFQNYFGSDANSIYADPGFSRFNTSYDYRGGSCPLDDWNDIDRDGVCGNVDSCKTKYNPGVLQTLDCDGNGDADVCDSGTRLTCVGDYDGDGVDDYADNCVDIVNPDQWDYDYDHRGDLCNDICPFDRNNDYDRDGICADLDNCPFTSNPLQENADGDLFGDACDIHLNNTSNAIDSGTIYGSADPNDYPFKVEEFLSNWSSDGNPDNAFNEFSILSAAEKIELRDYIRNAYKYDRDGNLRTGNPDIGAYEFQGAQTCVIDGDCNVIQCKIASCVAGECSYSDDGDGTICDDNNACTQTDSCASGICVGGNNVICNDSVICTIDSCNSQNGICSFTPDDGLCGAGEVCDLVNDCTAVGGCTLDSDCSDETFCNGAEVCNLGVCEQGFDPCDDGIGCTVETCNENPNLCNVFINDAICDDGLFCDGTDFCSTTLDCQNGTVPIIDDSTDCTLDSCDEINDIVVNEEDNSLCNIGEACISGGGCNPMIPDTTGFDGTTTNFTNVSDITNVSWAVLEITQFGKINFTNNSINFAGLNLSYVLIEDEVIEINTANPGMDRLNVSSRLSFYGISFVDPKILRDDIDCSSCLEISFANNIFVADVSGFSRYGVVEAGSSPPSDTGSPGGGGGGGSSGLPLAVCEKKWLCGGWTECFDGEQTRECWDQNECGDDENKPIESRECELQAETGFDERPEEQLIQAVRKLITRETLIAVGSVLGAAVLVVLIIYFVASRKKDVVSMKKEELQSKAAKQWTEREDSGGLR